MGQKTLWGMIHLVANILPEMGCQLFLQLSFIVEVEHSQWLNLNILTNCGVPNVLTHYLRDEMVVLFQNPLEARVDDLLVVVQLGARDHYAVELQVLPKVVDGLWDLTHYQDGSDVRVHPKGNILQFRVSVELVQIEYCVGVQLGVDEVVVPFGYYLDILLFWHPRKSHREFLRWISGLFLDRSIIDILLFGREWLWLIICLPLCLWLDQDLQLFSPNCVLCRYSGSLFEIRLICLEGLRLFQPFVPCPKGLFLNNHQLLLRRVFHPLIRRAVASQK